MKDISILNELIIGRVNPHIYAFTTNTVPNYLKVGDTYRPVSIRLNEWKKFFPDLTKQYERQANINEDIFFRDYSVHQYLENDLQKIRLVQEVLTDDVYFSNEFFKDTNSQDVEEAIRDIQEEYIKNSAKYQFYNAQDKLPDEPHYAKTGFWKYRPNQELVVENFKTALICFWLMKLILEQERKNMGQY